MKIERNEKRGGFYFEDKKSYRVECTKEYLYSILEYLKLTFNKSLRAPFFFTSQVYIYIYEQVDISPGINVARKKSVKMVNGDKDGKSGQRVVGKQEETKFYVALSLQINHDTRLSHHAALGACSVRTPASKTCLFRSNVNAYKLLHGGREGEARRGILQVIFRKKHRKSIYHSSWRTRTDD